MRWSHAAMKPACGLVVGMLSVMFSPLAAAGIVVEPGPGAIGAALANAGPGDVVEVRAGEYQESVRIPEGVTLRGAGADVTTLIGTDFAAIHVGGPGVVISGLTIRGGEETVRGVDSDLPVRIERCRFVGLREAVGLRVAPLSDVLACEFEDCQIGVRAIGEASPTVWGCIFRGGSIGVFAMQGGPYIRNNLFDGVEQGLRLVLRSPNTMIVRNNVFRDCKIAGIMILGSENELLGLSIRNSIFDGCGIAMQGHESDFKSVSHAIVRGIEAPAFRLNSGGAPVDMDMSSIFEVDPGLEVKDGYRIIIAHPQHTKDKGLRHPIQTRDALGEIGVEEAWVTLGVRSEAELPPARFGGERLISNVITEQYQYLRLLGTMPRQRHMSYQDGVPLDTHLLPDGRSLVFDISRHRGEAMIGHVEDEE